MKLSYAALALALSSSLVLSACSGADEPDNVSSAPTASGSSPGPTNDDDLGTGGSPTTESTESTDDDRVTASPVGAGVLSVEEAERTAAALMRGAAQSQIVEEDEALELNKSTFISYELLAANAATELRKAGLRPVIDYHPTGSNVLAIGREDGESPSFMLVQSVPESGLPELHLMSDQDDGVWKIAWSAPMLPGTRVGTFDARSDGSPMVREGALFEEAKEAVELLFPILDYPTDEDRPDYRTHGYGPQVAEAAAAQSAEVSDQATFEQTHRIRSGSMRTMQLADGSTISFPVLERESTFKVRDGMLLQPPKAFVHLSGDDTITESATMTTLVSLAVHVPAGGGDPEVIASHEQITEAAGS